MVLNLPPLRAIRAFDAGVRHQSFVKAAAELNQTPGAVAHQVKQLEGWLDVQLFVRRARGIELTPQGRQYHDDIKDLLEQLSSRSLAMRSSNAKVNVVTVTAMPSFVTRWLMPRLGSFRSKNSRIDVRILASVPPVELAHGHVDIAIRLGAGPYPGLHSELLFTETYLALCSPKYLERFGPFKDAASLSSATLLHDEYEPRIPKQIAWPAWFNEFGVKRKGRQLAGSRFSHTYLTLDAAIAGEGIALASDVLAAGAIERGDLVIAAPGSLPGPYAYRLLQRRNTRVGEVVSQFSHWISAEAKKFRRHLKPSVN